MTPRLNRRRFILIGSAAALGAGHARAATPVREWRGIALGAEARLILDHPDADRMIAEARAELSRLEAIFSLYRTDSALARLNATGRMDLPPSELLEVLALSGLVYEATDGLFDPTVQPLWQAHAVAGAAGRPVTEEERDTALSLVGWDRVEASASFDLPDHVGDDDVVHRPAQRLGLERRVQNEHDAIDTAATRQCT